tara:strand:- start:707 stop:1342 length:636 start_codon:yes stop_codon:yes gene_type:complete
MIETNIGNFKIHNYSNHILVIKNLIDDSFCKEIIKIINNSEHFFKIDYRKGNNVKGFESSMQNLLEKCDENKEKRLYVYIYNIIITYIKTITCIAHKINNNLFNRIPKISDIILRKIIDKTIPHCDGIPDQRNIRELTCIIALNQDYENGEFNFPDYNTEIKLERGDVLLFPPYWTHLHSVNKPEHNFRYTITFWFHSNQSTASWNIENIN